MKSHFKGVHLNGGGGGGSGGTSRARLNGLECPKGTWHHVRGTFPHILRQKTRVAIFRQNRKAIPLRNGKKMATLVFWLKSLPGLPWSLIHVPLGRLSPFRRALDVPSLPPPFLSFGEGREGTSGARLNGLKRPKGTWNREEGSRPDVLSQVGWRGHIRNTSKRPQMS